MLIDLLKLMLGHFLVELKEMEARRMMERVQQKRMFSLRNNVLMTKLYKTSKP